MIVPLKCPLMGKLGFSEASGLGGCRFENKVQKTQREGIMFPRCPICLERYTKVLRECQELILPCHHDVCIDCFKYLCTHSNDSKRTRVCPHCQIRLPGLHYIKDFAQHQTQNSNNNISAC